MEICERLEAPAESGQNPALLNPGHQPIPHLPPPPLTAHLAALGAAWALAVPLLFFLAAKTGGRLSEPG